ncbi:MAG: L-threonylcarbamoyladenylate synthase [Gemmatimonadales bacterium]|jgi:L-threonylcarbamoyladenylate synthase
MLEIEVTSALSDRERQRAAQRAAAVLRAGGVVIHPTETVYGIGGDGSARNNAVISRIKGRSAVQPLILLAASVESAQEFLPGLEWSQVLLTVAERLWPGPLTVIVRCAEAPAGLSGPGGGVALRVTPDPTVRAILKVWGRPMTSTSANLTGAPPARSLSAALELLKQRDDLDDLSLPALAIDAGSSAGERPSTIVSFVESPPRLVREGPVGRNDLSRWIDDIR